MRAPRVGPWGPKVHGGGAARGATGGGGRAGFGRGHGRGSSSWWRPRAGGVRPHSLWWARQASGMCGGDGTAMGGATRGGRVHMYGARIQPVLPPHRAARQDRERRARPRRRLRHSPARPPDERLADRDPRPRLAVLAGTVRRVGGPDHEPMRAGRDRPAGQNRPRRVHRARRTGRRRWRSVFETSVNASKSDQLPRNGLMSGSRKAVWKESVRRGRRPPWRSRYSR